VARVLHDVQRPTVSPAHSLGDGQWGDEVAPARYAEGT
jgi:hypothetical protein